MLPLLFAIIIFVFLLIGAIAFLISIAIPPLRRFALSAALWWAMWGPCSIAFMILAGLALVADAFINKDGQPRLLSHPHLLSTFGWTYLACGALFTIVAASAVAWLHQKLIHRCTFALFRLYATVVVAGIGSVFGWSLSWWMLAHGIAHSWTWSLPLMSLLVSVVGIISYRSAHALRGAAPKTLTWITPEEFTPKESKLTN